MPAAMNDEVSVLQVSGYRFLPTDLELIRDYLCNKITNQKLPSDVPVVEYDIYSIEPWNLPVNNKIDTINSNRSYYFVKLMDGIDRRIVKPSNSDDDHNNGIVALGGTRRGGDGGHWKKIAGGQDTRFIRDELYRSIGVKKSFAFHAYLNCPAPRHTNNNNNISTSEEDDGTTTTTTTITAMTTWKTNWIMDEYSLNSQRTQPWVLCILRKKGGGGEEDEEVELLSKLKQVQQQQQQQQQQPAIINHDPIERQELRMLGQIKTIQERIKTNQIQIWDDQQELRRLNGFRISGRRLKFCKIINAHDKRFEQIQDEFSKHKITIEELQELKYQLWEEYWRQKAEMDAENAVIRAGSYYQVQLPSRFKKRRKN